MTKNVKAEGNKKRENEVIERHQQICETLGEFEIKVRKRNIEDQEWNVCFTV